MKKKFIGQIVLVSSLLLAVSARAQVSSAVQQSERSQRFQEIQAPRLKLEAGESVPEIFSGESQDVGPQHLLKVKARRTWFEGYVDTQAYWTDNANLAGNGFETDSFVFVNTIQAALAPSGISFNERQLLPRLGVRAQWYNYTKSFPAPGLDFHNEVVFADVRYNFAENWQAFLGVDVGRLTTQDNYKEFYREIAPNWGARYLWKIADNKVVLFNYHGFYHISSTAVTTFPGVTNLISSDFNNRTDHNFSVSYNQEICPGLIVQPFYRFQFTHYYGSNNGNDFLHDVGINLSYYFNQWASVRTFFVYETKDSGTILANYDKFDGGIGASLDFRF